MKRVPMKRRILDQNERIAGALRSRFLSQHTLALNLISSPGAGKTSLLEQTLENLPTHLSAAVLTGDIATDNDAARLAHFGFPVQITTGGTCHLDGRMVEQGLAELQVDKPDLLLIENVGNLVCPAGFDLGEAAKVIVLSVTEGDDKPLKYPAVFVRSEILVLNKTDLLPHITFDVARACENARRVRPDIDILETSCSTGAGIEAWMRWLEARLETLRSPGAAGRAKR
jgi:hydrogenase nickel incorporation protein HypB